MADCPHTIGVEFGTRYKSHDGRMRVMNVNIIFLFFKKDY